MTVAIQWHDRYTMVHHCICALVQICFFFTVPSADQRQDELQTRKRGPKKYSTSIPSETHVCRQPHCSGATKPVATYIQPRARQARDEMLLDIYVQCMRSRCPNSSLLTLCGPQACSSREAMTSNLHDKTLTTVLQR